MAAKIYSHSCIVFLQLLFFTSTGFTQNNTLYPVGAFKLTEENFQGGTHVLHYPGPLIVGATDAHHPNGGFEASNAAVVEIKSEETHLVKAHLGGNSTSNFITHFSSSWAKIASNYQLNNGSIIPEIPIYEKLEIGINLPKRIQEKIDLFLNEAPNFGNYLNGQYNYPNHLGLNPYDPQDIDFIATIRFASIDQNLLSRLIDNQLPVGITYDPTNDAAYPFLISISGFYFQEVQATPDNLHWVVTNSEYPIRFRFAPPFIGDYKISIGYNYKSNGQIINETIGTNEATWLAFKGVVNSSNKEKRKGYLEVGHHKRHFRHAYDKTSFFGIGMNLPELPTHPSYDPTGQPGGAERYIPWGYQQRRGLLMGELSNKGGNFIRMISFNAVNAVEKTFSYTPAQSIKGDCLGNYHINQMHMHETDLDIERAEDLNIFILFCMQIHYPFMISNGSNQDEVWQNNPYNNSLNLITVEGFLTNLEAKRFFKNKLKYMQARWGYSAAIAEWQIMSEADQIGLGNGAGNGPWYLNSPSSNSLFPPMLNAWHCEMSNFLASQYPKHLIGTTYINSPFEDQAPVCIDQSFECINIDVISWHPYKQTAILEEDEPANRDRQNICQQIIYDPSNNLCTEDDGSKGFFIDKPILFSELGGYYDACTDIDHHNSIWAGAMSGQATTPLNWHNNLSIYPTSDAIQTIDYFNNYPALNSFMTGIDFEAHKYVPSVHKIEGLDHSGGPIWPNNNSITMDLEIFVVQNNNGGILDKSDRGFGWVHHKKANGFYNLGIYAQDPFCYISHNLGGDPPLINEIPDEAYAYNLNGFKTGEYIFDLYDTKTGQVFHSFQSTLTENSADLFGVLSLEIPHVPLYYNNDNDKRLDYAFKFSHVSNDPSTFRTNPSKEDSLAQPTETVSKGKNIFLETPFFVSVNPNPTKEKLFIKTEGAKISKIELTDPTGRLLFNTSLLDSNDFEVDLKNFSNGCYYLKVLGSKNNFKVFKIIKQ